MILAPMAGVTDQPFRLLAKRMGCGLVYSEMVSAKGLIFENQRTHDLVRMADEERPVVIQLFGSEPALMAAAAQRVAAWGADIIDVNMGCPTPKIIKNGDGAALLRNPSLAYEVLARTADAVNIPVTVKIRKGWDEQTVNAVEIAKLAQRAGVSAVAIHGRTREQFYAGIADWDCIRQVKASVTIPVIGNGDLKTAGDVVRMLEQTGCDAVMIGRGAQGNPWIFRQAVQQLQGQTPTLPSLEERLAVLKQHFAMAVAAGGEYIAVREMRRHAAWYTKGLRHAAKWRLQFNQAQSILDFTAIFNNIAACQDEK